MFSLVISVLIYLVVMGYGLTAETPALQVPAVFSANVALGALVGIIGEKLYQIHRGRGEPVFFLIGNVLFAIVFALVMGLLILAWDIVSAHLVFSYPPAFE